MFVKQCSIHRSRANYIWQKKQMNYKFIPTSLFPFKKKNTLMSGRPQNRLVGIYSRTPRKRTPLGPPRSVRLRGVSANGGLKFQKELKGQEQ